MCEVKQKKMHEEKNHIGSVDSSSLWRSFIAYLRRLQNELTQAHKHDDLR